MNEQQAISYRAIATEGLWSNNAGIVQLLGLCPMLAVTSTLSNAIGLGLATLLVLVLSNITVSLVRNYIPSQVRIPVFVIVIASFVSSISLFMNAYSYQLFLDLGIFIPLIVTNCIIIARAEAFASKHDVCRSAFDGLMMGLGFAFILALLGGIREILGQGSLFSGAEFLFGDWGKQLSVQIYQVDSHFLLAILPPGAFIITGFIIAAKRWLDIKAAKINAR